eukprot:TRINITY_DN466_c1_g1_i1.p1 TRINITY_DN466_c1_g1~~TRINITY_DN466_c1_g1_i1.p1  ORF type:complete len:195 (+),score=97.58 TRINITY_DN466_c1_g1_i1:141-725(+)
MCDNNHNDNDNNEPKKLCIPQVKESVCVFDEYLRLHRDTLQLANGKEYFYYRHISRTAGRGAVMVLATTIDNKFLIVEEYRHPTHKIIWGCPGGMIDPGENAIDAAKRELKEETGYEAENFKVVGKSFALPGLSNVQIHYVIAENARKTANAQLESSECLIEKTLTIEELNSSLRNGVDVDSSLLSALFYRSIQ